MDAAKVVIGEVQRDGCFQVLKFLRESVRQARESAHPHPHREVLALDKASRDVVRVRPSIREAPASLISLSNRVVVLVF